MSMHKIPLTDIEREGLKTHGLPIGTPSQLSDVFRHGVKWGVLWAQGGHARASTMTQDGGTVTNPNNCSTCDHKQYPDGGWCYMFKEPVHGACMSHTGRKLM